MKRSLLLCLLLFSNLYSQSAEDSKQWQSYFGVEGGVGLMDVEIGAVASLNLGLADVYYLRGLSYGGGILGGWQKYTSEKIGMRNTLGLRVFGAKATKTGNDEKYKKRKGEITVDSTFYYALDGLFDFTKNGKNRFGMSFGFSTDLLQITLGGGTGFGLLFKISPRLGFYTQFDNNIIELMVSVPLVGFVDFVAVGYNSTLTLGYKYLF